MDAINFSLTIDNSIAQECESLKPHKSVFNLDEPFKVSDNLSMPKPVIGTIGNWLNSPLTAEDYEPSKISAMNIIPEVM